MRGKCKRCGNIILEDLEEYKSKYPDEVYIQCPHCGEQGTIE